MPLHLLDLSVDVHLSINSGQLFILYQSADLRALTYIYIINFSQPKNIGFFLHEQIVWVFLGCFWWLGKEMRFYNIFEYLLIFCPNIDMLSFNVGLFTLVFI